MNYPSICFPKVCRSACALFMFFTCAAASAGNIAGVTSAPGVRLAAAPMAAGDDKPGHIVYKVDGQEVTKAVYDSVREGDIFKSYTIEPAETVKEYGTYAAGGVRVIVTTGLPPCLRGTFCG